MKKMYYLLALAVLCIVGVSDVQARKVLDQVVTEFQTGTPYLLQTACFVEGTPQENVNVLCNGNKTTEISEDCYVEFQEVGTTDDGFTKYVIKQVNSGKFVQDNSYYPTSEYKLADVFWTDNQAKAFVCTIKPATRGGELRTNEDGSIATNSAGIPRYTIPEDADLTSYTELQFDNMFVISRVKPLTDGGVLYFASGFIGNSIEWWSYTDTNPWFIMTDREATAEENLDHVLEKTSSLSAESSWSIGSNPGQVSQENFNAFKTAFDAAYTASNNAASYTSEQLQELADVLEAAYEALVASVVPLSPGYYYFQNKNYGACFYSTNEGCFWTENYEIPEKPTVDAAPYIWHLTQNGEKWYLQNYDTELYLGEAEAFYQAIPLSAEPVAYAINYNTNNEDGVPGYFNLANPRNQEEWTLHAQQAGKKLVYWYETAGSSLWQIVTVQEEDLAELRDAINQTKLNRQLQSLVEQASNAHKANNSYISDATKDANWDEAGLVTDAAQLSTNAQEPKEGPIEGLLDSDLSTFFHSMWSTTPDPNDYHYLQVDLGKEVEAIQMKYWKRDNYANDAQGTGHPSTITVAVADTNEPESLESANWREIGTYTLTYPYSATYTTDRGNACDAIEKENRVGLFGTDLDGAHRFIRVIVKSNLGNGLSSGYPFFYWSEVRFYEAALDPNCMNSVIDANIVSNLLAAIEKAKGELNAEAATQATIDELQAALDAYQDVVPDPALLRSLIEKAKSRLENAVEGDVIGCYESGAIAALQAVVDAVEPQISDVMEFSLYVSLRQQLEAALVAFANAFVGPQEGVLYLIKSVSTEAPASSPADHYLFAQNSNVDDNTYANVRWGYYTRAKEATDTEEAVIASQAAGFDQRLNACWLFLKQADGSYAIRNAAYGTYMANPQENDVKILMSDSLQTVNIIAFDAENSILNFEVTDGVYYNAQPNGNYNEGALVTWGNAAGNSLFTILESNFDPDLGMYVDVTPNQPAIITMPYEVDGTDYGAYAVLGVKDGAIQLYETYEAGETIPAGVPFVIYPEEGVESNSLYIAADAIDDMGIIQEYATEPGNRNGLCGVLARQELPEGVGLLREADNDLGYEILATVKGEYAAANTGYFSGLAPTETDGDLQLVGDYITGINNVVVLKKDADHSVYSISGVKLNGNGSLKNLPKGIYIVGGQKVLVK